MPILPEHVAAVAQFREWAARFSRLALGDGEIFEALDELAESAEIWASWDQVRENADIVDDQLVTDEEFLEYEGQLLIDDGAEGPSAAIITALVFDDVDGPVDPGDLPEAEAVRERVRALAVLLREEAEAQRGGRFVRLAKKGLKVIAGVAVLSVDSFAVVEGQLLAIGSLRPALKAIDRATQDL